MQAQPIPTLSLGARLRLGVQRGVARLLSPITTFAVAVLLRYWLRLSVVDGRRIRRSYHEIWRENDAPLLICGNHLTMIDSALIAWALAPPAWYVRYFSALPWNVPERRNFASTWVRRALVYIYKCIPIVRGGSREEISGALARFTYLLQRGDVGLIFPEGLPGKSMGWAYLHALLAGAASLVHRLSGRFQRGIGEYGSPTCPGSHLRGDQHTTFAYPSQSGQMCSHFM